MIVMPDDIWRSMLYARMNTTNNTYKMPNLARNLIDTNAVAVMGDWINSLPGIPALAPPTITPNGGTYANSVNVTLQSTNNNATLYYTLDGSLPTTNSLLYTEPFNLTNGVTVNANAFAINYNNSVATSALFFIQPLLFTSMTFNAGTGFQMSLTGTTGSNYVLQASTNLMNWTSHLHQSGHHQHLQHLRPRRHRLLETLLPRDSTVMRVFVFRSVEI